MARLHSIKIENFRGIKSLCHTFGNLNLYCLIGQGDSGKSTILDAIYYVLSPVWNETFNDADFFNCDHSNAINIEATLVNIPLEFASDHRFYDYLKSYNPDTHEISDELDEQVPEGQTRECAMTIQLKVNKELEPEWTVICGRHQEGKPISHNDRKKLNVFVISDSVDRHFQWTQRNPLYYLHAQTLEEGSTEQNPILEILRDAKKSLDNQKFEEFDETIRRVVELARKFGMDLPKTRSTIDFRDLVVKEGRFSLHDETVPFRLKGKGSKRLISMAIQTALCRDGGVMLIDEIEQSLESFRTKHAVTTFQNEQNVQIILTTHSNHVIEELGATSLLKASKGADSLKTFSEDYNGLLRSNPQAFFHETVVVCEGKTEIGVCRAINSWLQAKRSTSLALAGVGVVDGGGSKLTDRCSKLALAETKTILFCDSDDKITNEAKDRLRSLGITIIDFGQGECLETAAFASLPFQGVKELLCLAREIRALDDNIPEDEAAKRIWRSVRDKFGVDSPPHLDESSLTEKLRKAIGEAAKSKSNGWYKSEGRGEKFGKVCLRYLDRIDGTTLGVAFNNLINLIAG